MIGCVVWKTEKLAPEFLLVSTPLSLEILATLRRLELVSAKCGFILEPAIAFISYSVGRCCCFCSAAVINRPKRGISKERDTC